MNATMSDICSRSEPKSTRSSPTFGSPPPATSWKIVGMTSATAASSSIEDCTAAAVGLILVAALLAVNVALCFALVPGLGARGAALAFLISEVGAVAGMLLLYRQAGRNPLRAPQPPLIAAAAAMGAVALLTLGIAGESVSAPVILLGGGTATMAAYIGCLYALDAVPTEIQNGLVRPLVARFRP